MLFTIPGLHTYPIKATKKKLIIPNVDGEKRVAGLAWLLAW